MADFNCRVSGFLLDDTNRVLLIKRNRSYIIDNKDPDEHMGWEVCGGGLEHGEKPERAIEREYQEEVGIKVSAIKLFNVRTGVRDGNPLLNISYVCKYVSGEVKLTDEHTDYKWVPVSGISEYDLGQHTSIDKEIFIGLMNE